MPDNQRNNPNSKLCLSYIKSASYSNLITVIRDNKSIWRIAKKRLTESKPYIKTYIPIELKK